MAHRTRLNIHVASSVGDIVKHKDMDDVALSGQAKDFFIRAVGIDAATAKKACEATAVVGRRPGSGFFVPGEIGVLFGRDWAME